MNIKVKSQFIYKGTPVKIGDIVQIDSKELQKFADKDLIDYSASDLHENDVIGLMTRVKKKFAYADSPLPNGGVMFGRGQRIHLWTDDTWVFQEGHRSDLIRLQWLERPAGTGGAKPAITWYDSKGLAKVALVAHDKANNPAFRPHRHISIEVDTGTGELNTVMEWPYGKSRCEIQTQQSNFTVNGGVLRVSNENGANKEMLFCRSYSSNDPVNLDPDGYPIYEQVYKKRWGLRANSTNEAGGNSGSDLEFVTYDDNGGALSTALFMERKTGNIGLWQKPASFGGGQRVMFIRDVAAAPTTNPTGGLLLWAEAGTLKYRDSAGNVKTIQVA
ncbi:hypothetical protein D3C87_1038820 [compost metagenome]